MNNEWKIYTKTGDKGETALIGGKRVKKYDLRIEAYGTVDELNSYIGLLRDLINEAHLQDVLFKIQQHLFIAESLLATDTAPPDKILPFLSEDDVRFLEQEIDSINANLPVLKNFILPGGHPSNAFCHVARCVCRRAERITVHLAEKTKIDNNVIKYLNRLSDYLFVLARRISQIENATEILWIPKA
ncbi:MAG: cob(I)yrinic acid a,c-diamide adenosyltransferase [Lentimicrobiaceae bacterium]|nr:cob(I)yrinic acid a,c-diamide adenosyltransferase [Lentimicrobiaceae bacterium]